MRLLRGIALTILLFVAIVTLPIIFYKEEAVVITKEQQDNIVRKLARTYYITDVEFKKIVIFHSVSNQLFVKLNQDDKYTDAISFKDTSWMDEDKGYLILGPTDVFMNIKKDKVYENESVDISHVHIKYLGE